MTLGRSQLAFAHPPATEGTDNRSDERASCHGFLKMDTSDQVLLQMWLRCVSENVGMPIPGIRSADLRIYRSAIGDRSLPEAQLFESRISIHDSHNPNVRSTRDTARRFEGKIILPTS